MDNELALSLEYTRSREQLQSILSAAGNHEAKALLCVAMQDGEEYRGNQLSGLMIDAQGTHPTWRLGKSLGRDYCEESLTPAGLVIKNLDYDTGKVSYLKTNKGNLADALSGHLLELSLKYEEFSLYDIFGATQSTAISGKRSPAARLAIFEELLTQERPIQVKDLRNAHISDWANVSSHLLGLSRAGVITMSKRSNSDPIVQYKLGNYPLQEMRVRPEISSLTTDIRNLLIKFFEEHPKENITPSLIAGQLRSLSDNYALQTKAGLRGKVSQALNNFTNQNGLIKTNPESHGTRSQISLNERQEGLLTECMNIMYGFLDDSSFKEKGIEKSNKIIADTDLVCKLMQKARDHSPIANNRSDEEKFSSIHNLLVSGNALTVAEIDDLLDKGIGRYTIRATLRSLEERSQVRRTVIGGKITWSLLNFPVSLQNKG